MQHLNQRQVAAILCGLRVLQERLHAERVMAQTLTAGQRAILTKGGELKPLTAHEIDALCQAINLGQTFTLRASELGQLIEVLDFAESESAIAGEEVDTDDERKRLEQRGQIARRFVRQIARGSK